MFPVTVKTTNIMKKSILMAVAAIAVLSSCDPETNLTTGEETGNKAVFTATIAQEGATRVTLNSNTPNWEKDDQISINGTEFTAKTAGATTTFEGESVEKMGDKYKAYYPANLYNGGTPTLPSTITYTAGKFEMPMYAESADHDLTFKNLCGVFAITVTSADIATLKSIRVSSTDHGMSGAFTVSENAAVLTTKANVAANTVTLTCTDAVNLTSGGTVFYIPLPAQAYKGLTVDLSSDGTSYTSSMTAKGEITVLRNQIYDIDYAASASPTTGTTDGHDWVQLWENGPKFATTNLGETEVTGNTKTYTWTATGESDAAAKTWTTNWRVPTEEQMNELYLAASNTGSDKISCEYTTYNNDGSHWGFLFKGKKEGYTDNSLFLPASVITYTISGSASYWSGTAVGSYGRRLYLRYNNRSWDGGWYSDGTDSNYLVRPVLKN